MYVDLYDDVVYPNMHISTPTLSSCKLVDQLSFFLMSIIHFYYIIILMFILACVKCTTV